MPALIETNASISAGTIIQIGGGKSLSAMRYEVHSDSLQMLRTIFLLSSIFFFLPKIVFMNLNMLCMCLLQVELAPMRSGTLFRRPPPVNFNHLLIQISKFH